MTKRLLTLIAGLLVTIDFGIVTPRLGHGPVAQRGGRSRVSAQRKKFSSSTILKREGNAWGGERDRDFHVPPLFVSGGRLVVTARDTLYMLNSNRRVLWKYYVGAPVLDKLVLDSGSMIHGIAMDGIKFAVDLDGKRRWAHGMNGRATYAQIALYSRDQYLVVVDNSGYRESLSDSTIPDRMALCRGEETIWARDFPRNTELFV